MSKTMTPIFVLIFTSGFCLTANMYNIIVMQVLSLCLFLCRLRPQPQTHRKTLVAVMRRLYVGGLSHTITQKDLRERFGKFGEVEDVELRTRRDDQGRFFTTLSSDQQSKTELNAAEHNSRNHYTDLRSAE